MHFFIQLSIILVGLFISDQVKISKLVDFFFLYQELYRAKNIWVYAFKFQMVEVSVQVNIRQDLCIMNELNWSQCYI